MTSEIFFCVRLCLPLLCHLALFPSLPFFLSPAGHQDPSASLSTETDSKSWNSGNQHAVPSNFVIESFLVYHDPERYKGPWTFGDFQAEDFPGRPFQSGCCCNSLRPPCSTDAAGVISKLLKGILGRVFFVQRW